MLQIDPTTPVIIGVGQVIDRLHEDGYQALSPVDLAAAGAIRALEDTSADTVALAQAVDTVAGIRQFEISNPNAQAPLGKSNNFPRSVARRIGATPRRAILEVSGGQGPQHLVSELAAEIAAGKSRVALVFGSEAISTSRALAGAENKPDFSEVVDGDLEDRGFGLQGLSSQELTTHGLIDGPSQYALLENARRAKLGLSRRDYGQQIGRLFAPFTKIAAQNPYAAAPTERSAEELMTPTVSNRRIADPYTRYVVSRDQVNQGAAVLLASVEAARDLGVPEEKWVYIHGHADARELKLMDRPDLSESPAAKQASKLALEMAGVTAEEVTTWDFYSCFPIPVFNTAVDGLGLTSDDPRGLTVTGGLPFFGGAGNNYSMHAIAETVQRARKSPGSFGFVGANGGVMSKYSAAVYSTTPKEWQPDRSAELQASIDVSPVVLQVHRPTGWATIETFTITYDRQGRKTGIVVGRLEDTEERFVAMGLEGDEKIIELLETDQPIGQRIWVLHTGPGNRVTVSPERVRQLRPVREPQLREAYEHIEVSVEDHLLIVTINRPQARNALFPPAHEELSEVFDAFFADRELWVAIITGAGDKAFCAGNDLIYRSTGKPSYTPETGFAGLTSRLGMNKPVIAAVNGYAMGGGFETALACHLVVADETAQFALSEVRVGLMAGAGGVVRLPRAIPEKIAHELILTGRRINAEEAKNLGLVSRIVPSGTALEGAKQLAQEILQGSPTSVRVSLEVINETRGIPDVIEAVNLRTSSMETLPSSADAIEGVTAFAQKRQPQWKNQ